VYEPSSEEDGQRFLVDGLWPRGITKERADVKRWQKEVAPSRDLCKWFGHDAARWDEFKRRYFEELDRNVVAWRPLLEEARGGTITLVFGAKERRYNQAVALKEYLESKLAPDR